MQLVNTSGTVTDSYTYDAFGAMTSHTGTNPQPFGYAGQQQDVGAEGGMLYLRAREYDPALGRFLTQDPLPFLQRYAYAGDDPVSASDPSGACVDPSSALAVSGGTAVETGGVGPVVCAAALAGVVACTYYGCGSAIAGAASDAWSGVQSLFGRRHRGAGAPEKKFFDPKYSPPPPSSLWPNPPNGLEDTRIPPEWCRSNPKTCAALAFLLGSGTTYEYLHNSGVFDEAIDALRADKEQGGGSWFTPVPGQ